MARRKHALHGAVTKAIEAYDDASVHVAFIAEDFLRHWRHRDELEKAVAEWKVAQKAKDNAITAMLEKARSL